MNDIVLKTDADTYNDILNNSKISTNTLRFTSVTPHPKIDVELDDINDYTALMEFMCGDSDSFINFDEDNIGGIDNLNNYKKDVEKKNKESNRKKMFCEDCSSDDIIEDTSQGILVCKNCGQVISMLVDVGAEWTQYADDHKKDQNRCSQPISQLLPQSSTATTIGGPCSSRIKTLHGWNAMPYRERSLNDVFKLIQRKCQKAKMLKCIEDDAKITYKNVSECKHISGKNAGKTIIIRGKNRISLIAACVLNSCRKKDKTRSPKEIAELFDLKHPDLTKGYKIFQRLAKYKNIVVKNNASKPEHFITRFCEDFRIQKDFQEQAIKISSNAQKLLIASVHTPLSLATGSIYSMVHINNLAINKKTIAGKFNVSHVTIIKAFKKLEPFLGLLLDDDHCEKLYAEISKYKSVIQITDNLISQFIRFDIDIEDDKTLLSIIDDDGNLKENILDIHSKEISEKLTRTEHRYKLLKLSV